MGPIEWVVIGFTAVVASLTMLSEPTDVMVDQISAPQAMEESGYTAETLGQILEDATSKLFRDAGVHYSEDYSFRMNYRSSALLQLADAVKMKEVVEGLHLYLGLVNGRVAVTFVITAAQRGESELIGDLMAEIDFLDPATGRLLLSEEISGDTMDIPKLMDQVAATLVRRIKPNAYALHQFALESPPGRKILAADPLPTGTYSKTKSFVETWIVRHPLDGSHRGIFASEDDHVMYMAHMFNLLGVIYLLENESDAAAMSFMKTIELRGDLPMGYVNMGWLLSLQGNYDSALAYFERAEKLKPKLAVTPLYSAATLNHMGQYHNALHKITEAQSRAPTLAEVHDLKVLIMTSMGEDQTRIDEQRRKADLNRWRVPYQLNALAF
ncbi:MAG TPA: tetratricopeptide repeat protein [Arenicellales bacterium]|jgi:tetratricopeptide (TPR) repeat protein|nr:hypothetical protein [Nitrospinota bacterium]MDP6962468.1 tetratricopeptide repeat protein [Dehalococcoidia bacterium]HJP09564.1 tetratricopeptide repeat protein [Arenicellales bacterium]|tara:strand:+ start:12371 stop:13519 length:1149 start_codon:yes stop_codon:yes gene_type:complete